MSDEYQRADFILPGPSSGYDFQRQLEAARRQVARDLHPKPLPREFRLPALAAGRYAVSPEEFMGLPVYLNRAVSPGTVLLFGDPYARRQAIVLHSTEDRHRLGFWLVLAPWLAELEREARDAWRAQRPI